MASLAVQVDLARQYLYCIGMKARPDKFAQAIVASLIFAQLSAAATSSITPPAKPSAPPASGNSSPDSSRDLSAAAATKSSTPPTASGSIEIDDTVVPDVSSAPPLDVVDALNTALVKSPRAAAIRSQFGITEAGWAAVTVVPNPILFIDRGLVAEQEMRIGPVLTVEPPWKEYFRIIAQKRTLAQSRFDLMTQLWQLRSDVRRAYTEIVVAQETYKTLNELYDLASRLELVASKRFQAGIVPELDVLKARLATEQAATDRIVGAQRIIRARQQLNILMASSIDAPVNVPELPDFSEARPNRAAVPETRVLPSRNESVAPLAEYISKAESNRLELKSLREQIKLNETNIKSAYGNSIPNPTIALGKSTGGNVPTGPKITAVFFTINVQTPTANFNQGEIARYKATARQLRHQLASQRNQIDGSVCSAYQTMLGAREKLFTYQDHILADSHETARLARRSYEVGQSDITATLAAQQANVQIHSQYLDAVSTYQQSFTDLEQACGIPLQ